MEHNAPASIPEIQRNESPANLLRDTEQSGEGIVAVEGTPPSPEVTMAPWERIRALIPLASHRPALSLCSQKPFDVPSPAASLLD